MNDSSDSSGTAKRWLLLLVSLPAKPDYLRVKLRRRLQKIGAGSLKGAVYLLPNTPERLAEFQGVRREVIADGGDGAIWLAEGVDGVEEGDLIALLNTDRDGEYAGFNAAADELERRWRTNLVTIPIAQLRSERERLFARLAEILERDHFGADGREPALQHMERLAVLDLERGSTTT